MFITVYLIFFLIPTVWRILCLCVPCGKHFDIILVLEGATRLLQDSGVNHPGAKFFSPGNLRKQIRNLVQQWAGPGTAGPIHEGETGKTRRVLGPSQAKPSRANFVSFFTVYLLKALKEGSRRKSC